MGMKTELRDLLISWAVLSGAFSMIIFRSASSIVEPVIMAVPVSIAISVLAVSMGFVLHELAHRQVARMYGAHAEFRKWNFGLIMALILPFFGFLFAAPGAVYIYGPHLNLRQNGKISIAGPATNILGAVGLFVLAVILMLMGFMNDLIALVFMYVIQINLWFALFNLIPFPPLDGSKIITWNPIAWGILFIPLAILFFVL